MDEFQKTIEYILCRKSPYYFIRNYCLTSDSLAEISQKIHAGSEVFYKKPFPELSYIKFLCDLYRDEDLIVVAKSRQMMVTWTYCALLLWQVLFHRAQLCIIQCLKEENANDHIQNKVKVLYDNLPDWLKELRPANTIKNEFNVTHDKTERGSDSRIKAVQQGADAVRQFTASVILSDEMAFQPEAGEAYAASMPATIGRGTKRGKYIGVSTANNKNFFWRLWDDEFYTWQDISRGLRLKKNPNGFTAVRLHYLADPEKNEAWASVARMAYRGGQEGWEREQEIDFNVSVGMKYFPEWSPDHELTEATPIEGRELLRSWDFGFRTPACTVWQLNSKDQLVGLYEFVGKNMNTFDFATMVVNECEELFPNHKNPDADGQHDYMDYCDIAGLQTNSKSNQSDVDILNSFEIYPLYSYIHKSKGGKSAGLKIARLMLRKREDGEPSLLIDVSKMPVMAEGWRGAFHFKVDRDGHLLEEEYASDNDSVHLFDTLKYIIMNNPDLNCLLESGGEIKRQKTDPRKMTIDELVQHGINNLARRINTYTPTRFRRLSAQ